MSMFTKPSLFVGGRRACLLAVAESGGDDGILPVAETPIHYTEETRHCLGINVQCIWC